MTERPERWNTSIDPATGKKMMRPSVRNLTPQQGLMSRDYNLSWPNVGNPYEGVLVGAVYHFEWQHFEPNEGDFSEAIFDSIRTAAARVRANNPLGGLRLNMLGGTQSPQWVKDQNDPFPYVEAQAGFEYSCPRWWYNSYQESWQQTMQVLAAEIGDEIIEVKQSGGGTRYGEPFIRSIWANQEVFRDMGFVWSMDNEALSNFVTIMSCTWPGKLLYKSAFDWQYLNDDLLPRASLDLTIEALTNWSVDVTGAHDLREIPGDARLNLWQRISEIGIPIYFQTAQPSLIGDWEVALEWGVQFKARNIELVNAFQDYDLDRLQYWSNIYEAGT